MIRAEQHSKKQQAASNTYQPPKVSNVDQHDSSKQSGPEPNTHQRRAQSLLFFLGELQVHQKQHPAVIAHKELP